jgi:hypothetical protein
MKIKSTATYSEESSPFYTKNKDFCLEIERYIQRKGGTLEGKFNAWSYIVQGEIMEPKKWALNYKKATFTSSGNLFLSSGHQSLLVRAEWRTELKNTPYSEFKIRKKTNFDCIKMTFSQSIKELVPNSKYSLIQNGNTSDLVPKLYPILKPLFKSGEVFEIVLENELLKIELRTKKHYFDILEKIMTKL